MQVLVWIDEGRVHVQKVEVDEPIAFLNDAWSMPWADVVFDSVTGRPICRPEAAVAYSPEPEWQPMIPFPDDP